jgi:hypothetical protein
VCWLRAELDRVSVLPVEPVRFSAWYIELLKKERVHTVHILGFGPSRIGVGLGRFGDVLRGSGGFPCLDRRFVLRCLFMDDFGLGNMT